jgi:hypothetical protein
MKNTVVHPEQTHADSPTLSLDAILNSRTCSQTSVDAVKVLLDENLPPSLREHLLEPSANERLGLVSGVLMFCDRGTDLGDVRRINRVYWCSVIHDSVSTACSLVA